MKKKSVLYSIALGVSTFGLIVAIATFFPQINEKFGFYEYLFMPGAIMLTAFYPQGLHTGNGSIMWAYLLWPANAIFYSALWIGIFWLANLIRKKPKK